MEIRLNSTKSNNEILFDVVLCDEDCVEGVFFIEAKSEKTFFNRKLKIETAGFSDGFFESHEEDEEGGIWKLITVGYFDNVDELNNAIKELQKYKWLSLNESYIIIDS